MIVLDRVNNIKKCVFQLLYFISTKTQVSIYFGVVFSLYDLSTLVNNTLRIYFGVDFSLYDW